MTLGYEILIVWMVATFAVMLFTLISVNSDRGFVSAMCTVVIVAILIVTVIMSVALVNTVKKYNALDPQTRLTEMSPLITLKDNFGSSGSGQGFMFCSYVNIDGEMYYSIIKENSDGTFSSETLPTASTKLSIVSDEKDIRIEYWEEYKSEYIDGIFHRDERVIDKYQILYIPANSIDRSYWVDAE